MDTRFEQTSAAIALKADATTVGALEQRVEAAEQKVTPQAITSAVTSSALYAYEKYAGRNYCLNSGNTHTFVDNRYRNPNGTMTNYTGWNMSVSEDLFAHSGNGATTLLRNATKRRQPSMKSWKPRLQGAKTRRGRSPHLSTSLKKPRLPWRNGTVRCGRCC